MIEAAKLEADIYPAGPRGLSAYEIYKKEGGQLSEEEWLKSLNGLTPTIGENGNWFLGTVDTGLPSRGPKGDTGDVGPAGPAGYTPVKGTDYFTAEDKAEMVNAVLAALPSAEGVGY